MGGDDLVVTWLYVPGDRPERFGKAAGSGADVVIIDLEDAVEPAGKDQARENALAYLAEREPGGPAVHVRVNDLATARGREDARALRGSGVDGVRVPKVEEAGALDLLEGLPVYALLESARGVLNALRIAEHPSVAGIALGEQDLAAELSITADSAMDHLRMQVILAAAAAGLPQVPMSVYPDVRDEAGLLASSVRGRALGLYGRAAIHPRQLEVIRRAFRPTGQEVERAREVVALAGQGASALPDGRFVDAPVIARARQVLRLAGEEI